MLSSNAIDFGPRDNASLHPTIAAMRSDATPLAVGAPERLAKNSTQYRTLQYKEHLFCEGDARAHVYQVEVGVITVYRMLNDGRRQIIDFAFPGDFAGLGTTEEHAFSAEASALTRVRCYRAGDLNAAARRDPNLALQLYQAVTMELSAARALLVTIGQRSALERVATFLLMLQKRKTTHGAAGRTVHLPMRRADIGDFLGLTIETVSRSMTKLRTKRIIEIYHGTDIRILDEDRLQDISEGKLLV